ncbi:MAG: hypothetical protein V4697_00395 [Patescibacteria group bacterium]
MKKNLLTFLIIAITFVFAYSAEASETNGTIDASDYSARICKDAACSSYGRVNWKPTGATAVAITDSGLTGYIWGDEIGWVRLNPVGAGVSLDATTGVLSGYAFANTGSWINFNPTDVGGGTDVGVTIDSDGEFVGWAWVSGAYGGWMKFDCGLAATCVKTDWRPIGSRTGGTEEAEQEEVEEGGTSSGSRPLTAFFQEIFSLFLSEDQEEIVSENTASSLGTTTVPGTEDELSSIPLEIEKRGSVRYSDRVVDVDSIIPDRFSHIKNIIPYSIIFILIIMFGLYKLIKFILS